MTVEKDEQEIIFGETNEMYALTDLVNGFEFIDSKSLDYSIGGKCEEDLENEVSNYLGDLHAEMVQLVNFINYNFKSIEISLPVSIDIGRWIKNYKERLKTAKDNSDNYITQYYSGRQNERIKSLEGFIKSLEYIKERVES